MNPNTADLTSSDPEVHLFALRQQHDLLGRLRADVEASWRLVVASPVTATWRSNAQSSYSERRESVCAQLQAVMAQLDDALADVTAAVNRITVGL